MIEGENYYSSDPELVADRLRAIDLCFHFNHTLPSQQQMRKELLEALLPNVDKLAEITGPFFCDYGYNIKIGQRFYANTDLTILDIAPVTIGDDVMFAPMCNSIPRHILPILNSEFQALSLVSRLRLATKCGLAAG